MREDKRRADGGAAPHRRGYTAGDRRAIEPLAPRGTCYGVGVGPGDPELLTLKACRVLERCPVVAAPQTRDGAMLALDIARGAVDLAGKEVVALPFAMGRDAAERALMHRAAAEAVCAHLARGRDVAVANLGDVGVFATFSYIAPLIEERGFCTQMIPGVTSFSAVAARLGMSLTEMDEPLVIVPASAGRAQLERLLGEPGTKVLMKPASHLAEVLDVLRERGLFPCARLVANCGLPGELVCEDLAALDASAVASYYTTIVVKG